MSVKAICNFIDLFISNWFASFSDLNTFSGCKIIYSLNYGGLKQAVKLQVGGKLRNCALQWCMTYYMVKQKQSVYTVHYSI